MEGKSTVVNSQGFLRPSNSISDHINSQLMAKEEESMEFNVSSENDLDLDDDPLKIDESYYSPRSDEDFPPSNYSNEKAYLTSTEVSTMKENHCGVPNRLGKCTTQINSPQVATKKHQEDLELSCDVCGENFSRPKQLNLHLKTHAKDVTDLYKCSYCGKVYKKASTLTTHVKTHTEPFPHVCKTCGRRYQRKNKLTIHERVHSGERPYVCPICKRAFNTGSTLKNHMKTHRGEIPHPCTKCDKGFTNAEDLKAHMNFHPKDKPFSCAFCDDCFDQYALLKDHLRTHNY